MCLTPSAVPDTRSNFTVIIGRHMHPTSARLFVVVLSATGMTLIDFGTHSEIGMSLFVCDSTLTCVEVGEEGALRTYRSLRGN